MTWREWHAARQLLAEEAIGKYLRASGAQEEAEYQKTAALLRRDPN